MKQGPDPELELQGSSIAAKIGTELSSKLEHLVLNALMKDKQSLRREEGSPETFYSNVSKGARKSMNDLLEGRAAGASSYLEQRLLQKQGDHTLTGASEQDRMLRQTHSTSALALPKRNTVSASTASLRRIFPQLHMSQSQQNFGNKLNLIPCVPDQQGGSSKSPKSELSPEKTKQQSTKKLLRESRSAKQF